MTLKKIIADNFAILLRCIDLSPGLWGVLMSDPFEKDCVSDIAQQRTEVDKVCTLLGKLLAVPDHMQEETMKCFISALRSSGQEHVANILSLIHI